MLSAMADLDDRLAGLRSGGDDYVLKPFEPSELSFDSRCCCAGHHAHRRRS